MCGYLSVAHTFVMVYMKNKVRKSAFESYLKLKERSKKKLKNLNYKDFGMQPYLNSNKFSTSEQQLLFSLRSCKNELKITK